MPRKKREFLKKHSASIQITNTITSLQRKLWNLLLAHAYDDLPKKDNYQISIRDLMEALNYDSNDDKYLKDSLEALTRCAVKWDLFNKDGREWGVIPLLAGTILKEGICTYSFSPLLRERLYNPNIYAKISLSLQNKFRSSHALALYEFFKDYFKVGETPEIPLEKFKELMGLVDTEYPDFKYLNREVIKDVLNEINEKSDLETSAEYYKERKKVVALKFYIKVKENSPLALTTAKIQQKQLPSPPNTSPPLLSTETLLPPPVPTPSSHSTLLDKLTAAGISKAKAQKLVSESSSDRIESQLEAFEYLKANEPNKLRKNATGFLIKSIEEDYAEPNGLSERKRWESQEQEIERMERGYKQKDEERWRKEEEERERLQYFFDSLPTEKQNEIMEKALRRFRDTSSSDYKDYIEKKAQGMPLHQMSSLTQTLITQCRNHFLKELSEKKQSLKKEKLPLPTGAGLTKMSNIIKEEMSVLERIFSAKEQG